jgi:hypothetical protein
MNVQFVKKSSNSKIGGIPCTTTSRESCPDSCPLKGDGGCYAEAGYYTRMNWDKVTAGLRGGDWTALCSSISKLPEGQLWRHNVAGDLPHEDGKIDGFKLRALVHANKGKNGFTYTHHRLTDHNLAMVRAANADGFTINASANTLEEADKFAVAGLPVVVLLPSDHVGKTETPDGRAVVQCPATIADNVNCESCKLCAKRDRKTIVGFPAHGTRAKAVDLIVR